MPSPVLGSQPKESMTQFSLAAVPPGARPLGYTRCGPLDVRSVSTTRRVPSPPAAAAWMQATEVAQACMISGPETASSPSFAASVGAP